MFEIYIYNRANERIGILQHTNSVQWLEDYRTYGEVKIEARPTANNLAMLVEDNRLYNSMSDTVARICHADIDQVEGEEVLVVRAYTDAWMLTHRPVVATENITNIEAAMYSIYSKNRRNLSIGVGTAQGYTEKTEMEITWGSVLAAEEKLAELSGFGFKVVFNPETGAETFKVYKGVDRSKETYPTYVGHFGTDVGNIQNVTVSSGSEDYKNVAYVAGAGEGADRTVRIVSLGNFTGDDRREMDVDARDLQREYQVATPTGEYDSKGNPIYTYETRTYTNAQYNAMLDARGYEKLAECLKTFSITCDVTQTNIVYGEDYLLGDRMPVKLPEYGIYATARVSSVTMVQDEAGDKITALLSEFELEEVA